MRVRKSLPPEDDGVHSEDEAGLSPNDRVLNNLLDHFENLDEHGTDQENETNGNGANNIAIGDFGNPGVGSNINPAPLPLDPLHDIDFNTVTSFDQPHDISLEWANGNGNTANLGNPPPASSSNTSGSQQNVGGPSQSAVAAKAKGNFEFPTPPPDREGKSGRSSQSTSARPSPGPAEDLVSLGGLLVRNGNAGPKQPRFDVHLNDLLEMSPARPMTDMMNSPVAPNVARGEYRLCHWEEPTSTVTPLGHPANGAGPPQGRHQYNGAPQSYGAPAYGGGRPSHGYTSYQSAPNFNGAPKPQGAPHFHGPPDSLGVPYRDGPSSFPQVPYNRGDFPHRGHHSYHGAHNTHPHNIGSVPWHGGPPPPAPPPFLHGAPAFHRAPPAYGPPPSQACFTSPSQGAPMPQGLTSSQGNPAQGGPPPHEPPPQEAPTSQKANPSLEEHISGVNHTRGSSSSRGSRRSRGATRGTRGGSSSRGACSTRGARSTRGTRATRGARSSRRARSTRGANSTRGAPSTSGRRPASLSQQDPTATRGERSNSLNDGCPSERKYARQGASPDFPARRATLYPSTQEDTNADSPPFLEAAQYEEENTPVVKEEEPNSDRENDTPYPNEGEVEMQDTSSEIEEDTPIKEEEIGKRRVMREEYVGLDCSICREQADGLHYGALSCRSCNAFFRRAVTYNQQYTCRFSNDCVINRQGRCSCRACRFRKCLEAGMQVKAVQPRRDPTGSQKDRRRKAGSMEMDDPMTSPQYYPPSTSGLNMNIVKKEEVDEEGDSSSSNDLRKSESPPEEPGPSKPSSQSTSEGYLPHGQLTDSSYLDKDSLEEYEQFERLVIQYGDHLRLMELAMTSFTDFLEIPNYVNGLPLRKMEPTDVDKLSNTELSGLLYWIEKMEPYSHLPSVDRTALLKRYSVRKLSLDHFYKASKDPEQMDQGNFVMLNGTFVPPGETGFETVDDDAKQRKAKKEIFEPTFERIWRCVIRPFHSMKITDAEIVFLHAMLLWSPLNQSHVLEKTKDVMLERREWHTARLIEFYESSGLDQGSTRYGEVVMILSEIEVICDQHCQDFQVAKLFEFCDMSKYWYESLCYSSVNTMPMSGTTTFKNRTPLIQSPAPSTSAAITPPASDCASAPEPKKEKKEKKIEKKQAKVKKEKIDKSERRLTEEALKIAQTPEFRAKAELLMKDEKYAKVEKMTPVHTPPNSQNSGQYYEQAPCPPNQGQTNIQQQYNGYQNGPVNAQDYEHATGHNGHNGYGPQNAQMNGQTNGQQMNVQMNGPMNGPQMTGPQMNGQQMNGQMNSPISNQMNGQMNPQNQVNGHQMNGQMNGPQMNGQPMNGFHNGHNGQYNYHNAQYNGQMQNNHHQMQYIDEQQFVRPSPPNKFNHHHQQQQQQQQQQQPQQQQHHMHMDMEMEVDENDSPPMPTGHM